MAETEHTLRLKATLDTSEVRDQIDRLNGSRGGSPSARSGYPSNAANGMPSSTMVPAGLAGLTAVMTVLKHQFGKLGTALGFARGRVDSFSKGLGVAKGLMDNFSSAMRQAITQTLRNNMLNDEIARGNRVVFGGNGGGLGMGGFPPPLASAPRSSNAPRQIGNGGAPRQIGNGGSPRQIGNGGSPRQIGWSGANPLQFRTGGNGTAMQKPWDYRQLARWGVSYVGGTAVKGLGEYLGATQSPYADRLTAFGGMLQGASMGAAAGTMAGPHGWLVGAAVGASISAIDSLFDHITKKAKETQEKISSALAVDPARKANIAVASDMLRSMRYESESAAIGRMFEGDLKKVIREASNAVSDIESRIDSMDYKDADELQSMLNERQRQMSLRESAASRLDAFRKEDERKAELAKQEAKRLEIHQTAIGSLSTGLDRSIESRYHAQRLAAMAYNSPSENEADEEWLREGYSSYGKRAAAAREAYRETLQKAKSAKTSDEAQKFVEQANRQRETWQFLLGRQDFFKGGVLQTLQERLSRIAAPDLSNVTSLGQYGYGMGERNDNIDRQMRVWEDQYDVQRQILDVVRDRTFEASYSE